MKLSIISSTLLTLGTVATLSAANEKPNILIIWGDDIGQSNVSAYSKGVMGYKTPNIDSIAKAGDDIYRLLC